jgi:hypothetical protein
MKLRVANVNEEGETYRVHTDLQPALVLLAEFPNDSIVITVEEM